MKKYLNHFKYIDTYELWYDDPDNPIYNSWIDIEGIGYGWLWLNHKDSKRLQRKSIIKFAMDLYKRSKNEMCVRIDNSITDIFLESKDGDCIFHIRVSNNELDCWQKQQLNFAFKGGYMTREERLKELELEYEEFVKTDSGKRWLDDCKSRNNGQTGDSGDYIYDFYPEILM